MQRQCSEQHLHGPRWRQVGRLRPLEWAVLTLGGSAAWLSMPRAAHAECGWLEPSTCVNAAQYAFWHGLAIDLWSINRVLLTLAYQLDILRDWLVTTVFTSVFQIVKDTISPALAPIATIAVLVGVLVFLLLPIIGRVEIVNIRRALVWIVVAPLLLTIAGQGLASAEQLRATIGQTMFAAAQSVGSTPQFGATSDEMNSSAPSLYPFNGCHGGTLARPSTDGSSGGLFMDDLAAALMYANAQDIHCPNAEGPGTDLPDAFYSSPPTYATTQDVSTMSAAASKTWAENIQRGVTRLTMGLIPGLLAVLNAIIQLLFALALVLLFIALPLGLLLVFFTDTAAGVTGLLRRGVHVLQTSWSASLLLGIVFVALLGAARLGNVSAFVGLSIAGIFLTLFIIFVAVHAFMHSVGAVGQTVGLATGLGAGVAGQAVGGAAGVALRGLAATKAAGEMGLTYNVARNAGTSRRYALAAAAGRVRGVARVGELAAALGVQNELTDGIYTGYRGVRTRDGYRAIQRNATTDAQKTYGGGLTMREREEQRALQWAADRARRGSNLEEAGRIVGGSVRAIAHPVAAVRAGAHAATPGMQRVQELGGDTWRGAWERARAARDSVVERAGAQPDVLDVAAAVAGAASNHFVRDARSGRMVNNGRGGVRYLPRLAAEQLPAWALREPATNVNAGRLLQLGHHLQYEGDGSVTFWHPDGPAVVQDNPAPGNAPALSARVDAPRTPRVANAAPGAQPPVITPGRPSGTGAGGATSAAMPAGAAPASASFPPPSPGAAPPAAGGPPPATSTGAPGTAVLPTHGQPPASLAPVATGLSPHAQAAATGTAQPPAPRTPRSWQRLRRRAALELLQRQRSTAASDELTRAQTRLLLVQQGAIGGTEVAAQQAVARAERQVVAAERARILRPPLPRSGTPLVQPQRRRAASHQHRVQRSQRWHYRPGMPLPSGVPPPTPLIVQGAGERNAAVEIDPEGYAVPVPQVVVPPPERRLDLAVTDIRDLDGVLQAGYQVYQAAGIDRISVWPRADTPGVHWFDPGTPRARPDLVRERRRLGHLGVITMPQPSRPMRPRRIRSRGREISSRRMRATGGRRTDENRT